MRVLRSSIPIVALLAVLAAGVLYAPILANRISYAMAAGENKAVRDNLAELSRHDSMSPLFRAVAKAVQPAVVVVNVRQKVRLQPGQMPDMDELLKRFFGDEFGPMPRPRMPSAPARPREFFAHGLGSGVVVDAEKGYVLTNWHVVRDAENVEVVLADDRKETAEWIRTDPQTDLAIIKIKPEGLLAAPLGDSDDMEVGDWVLAIGAPRGLSKTVTAGIISAKGRVTGRSGYESFLQTDTAINQGNSGGPLVNMRGEVIGVNTAIVSHVGGNEGIGFAIPSNMVKQVMTQLIEKGRVERGFLGVTIQNVDEKLAHSFNLPDSKGALVSGVAPKSPAAKADIRPGDFLVSVGGKKVESVNELRNEVASLAPGKSVPVELYRDGKKITVEVKLEAQPKDMAALTGLPPTKEETSSSKFGIKVAPLTKDLAARYGLKASAKGVVITGVDPKSDAAEQGLREGLIIRQVGGKDVATVEEFEKAVSSKDAAGGVRLLVADKDGAQRFVFIAPGK